MLERSVLSLGCISPGILETSEIIMLCFDLLNETSESYAQSIRDNYYTNDRIILELVWGNDIPEGMEDDAEELKEAIVDALQDFCPPFCYFGSHLGNKSDYGVWFNSEEFDEACHAGEVVMLLDGPPTEVDLKTCPDAFYFSAVTDHGNLTVWAPERTIVLEMV